MNMYFRIAGTNKASLTSQIYAERYKKYNAYHDSLLHNKLLIEKEINFYWTYVKEHVDVDAYAEKELFNRNSDLSLRRKTSIADRTRYFETDQFALRANRIPGIEVVETEEVAADYKVVNK